MARSPRGSQRKSYITAVLQKLPPDLHEMRLFQFALRTSLKDEAALGAGTLGVPTYTQYQRRFIGQKTKAALRDKRERGERAGNVPYGYQLNPDGRTLDRNEAEQAVLSILGELRASGYSQRQIAAELNRQELTTRRGTAWRHQYVANLQNKAN